MKRYTVSVTYAGQDRPIPLVADIKSTSTFGFLQDCIQSRTKIANKNQVRSSSVHAQPWTQKRSCARICSLIESIATFGWWTKAASHKQPLARSPTLLRVCAHGLDFDQRRDWN